MPFVAAHPERYVGTVVGNGHCVAYVRAAADVPHTSSWRRGNPVRGRNHASGTAIATFHGDRYANATDGSSHAAILIEVTGAGVRCLDQWLGRPVTERTIRFKAGDGLPCDDGDAYHVVEAAT
jgi:hypothetical protein